MVRKTWLLGLLMMVIISLGVFALKGFGKEERTAEKEQDAASVSEKINEVLKNQQDIIARLEDIRNQLDIIRVRASRR